MSKPQFCPDSKNSLYFSKMPGQTFKLSDFESKEKFLSVPGISEAALSSVDDILQSIYDGFQLQVNCLALSWL